MEVYLQFFIVSSRYESATESLQFYYSAGCLLVSGVLQLSKSSSTEEDLEKKYKPQLSKKSGRGDIIMRFEHDFSNLKTKVFYLQW